MTDPKPKPPTGSADWQATAEAAYHAQADHWAAALLARAGIPPARAVYTLETPYRLLVEIDGERFRLARSPFGRRTGWWGDHLMLLRPCPLCGQGEHVSPWADDPAALGQVLAHFHPVCLSCKYLGRG